MRRILQGVVLSVIACAAASAMAQVGYGGGQAANAAGYGGTPAMMVANPQVSAPDFHGMTLQEAQAANVLVSPAAKQANGTPRLIFSKLNTTGPADGVVDSQTPVAGTKVYPGRQVATLTMKAAQITVPVLKGMTAAEARSRLTQSSLVLGQIDGDATLRIATQTPTAGMSVAPLTVVSVVMQAPPGVAGVSGTTGTEVPEVKTVLVPSVLTLREGAASTELISAGLGKPLVLGPANGVVGMQTPAAGTRVAAGSRVRLVMRVQKDDIIIVQPKSSPWGWYAAGGVVLLGVIGAFLAARRSPVPPGPKPTPLPGLTATMVARANVASAVWKRKNNPSRRWTVQFRDKPAAGVTVVKGEIDGRRR